MFHLLVLLSLIASNAYGVSAVLLTTSLLAQLGFNSTSTYIYIWQNITEIDWNAFRGFSNMVMVSMSYNQLTKLDIGVFRDGTNLKRLDIGYNPLIRLSNSRNYTYPSLESFALGNIPLTSLDANVINAMPNLIGFEAGDQLKPLQPNQLSPLKKLQSLTITTRNQRILTREHFNGISSIMSFKFTSSNIKTFEPDILIKFPNLTFTDLSNNEMTALDFLQFPSNPIGYYYYILDLHGNKLNSFRLCPTIQSINVIRLNNNQFTTFKSMDFTYLTNLQELDLSNNPLSSPDEIASHLKILVNLTYINLGNLSISSIDSNYFENNSKLGTINLSNNKISVLPYDVFTNSKAKYLSFVDLSNNQISFLDKRTFVGIDLYYLNFINNKLTNIGAGTFYISSRVNYNNLYFSNNLITEVDKFAFSGGSPGLQNVYLDGNNLTRLDDSTFAGCTKLRRVDLKNNPYLIKDNLQNLCPTPRQYYCSVVY